MTEELILPPELDYFTTLGLVFTLQYDPILRDGGCRHNWHAVITRVVKRKVMLLNFSGRPQQIEMDQDEEFIGHGSSYEEAVKDLQKKLRAEGIRAC